MSGSKVKWVAPSDSVGLGDVNESIDNIVESNEQTGEGDLEMAPADSESNDEIVIASNDDEAREESASDDLLVIKSGSNQDTDELLEESPSSQDADVIEPHAIEEFVESSPHDDVVMVEPSPVDVDVAVESSVVESEELPSEPAPSRKQVLIEDVQVESPKVEAAKEESSMTTITLVLSVLVYMIFYGASSSSTQQQEEESEIIDQSEPVEVRRSTRRISPPKGRFAAVEVLQDDGEAKVRPVVRSRRVANPEALSVQEVEGRGGLTVITPKKPSSKRSRSKSK